MQMPFRILLEDHLLPVQAFFNCFPPYTFLNHMESFAQGNGTDYNGVGCHLAGEDEAPTSGGLFYIPFEEIWISSTDILKHLVAAVEIHVNRFPEDKIRAENLLSLAKTHFIE